MVVLNASPHADYTRSTTWYTIAVTCRTSFAHWHKTSAHTALCLCMYNGICSGGCTSDLREQVLMCYVKHTYELGSSDCMPATYPQCCHEGAGCVHNVPHCLQHLLLICAVQEGCQFIQQQHLKHKDICDMFRSIANHFSMQWYTVLW